MFYLWLYDLVIADMYGAEGSWYPHWLAEKYNELPLDIISAWLGWPDWS